MVKEEKKKIDMESCKNTWGKENRREDELGHTQKGASEGIEKCT